MITRRDFLDTMAVGAAAPRRRQHSKELCADHGRPTSGSTLPSSGLIWPRLRASLGPRRQSRDGSRGVCLRRRKQHPGEVCRRGPEELGYAPQTEGDFRKIPSAKMSTLSPSPPRTTGTRLWPSRAWKPASTSMWRSPAVTIPPEGALLIEAAEEIRQAGADGHAAALLRRTHRNRPEDSRWGDRPGLLRDGLVRKHAQVHRPWQGRARAATLDWDLWQGPAPRRPYKTTSSLILALVAYGAPAKPSTTQPRNRRLPLGAGRRLSQSRGRHRRPLPLQDTGSSTTPW